MVQTTWPLFSASMPAIAQAVPVYFIHFLYHFILLILQGLQRSPQRPGIETFCRVPTTCSHLLGIYCLLLVSLSSLQRKQPFQPHYTPYTPWIPRVPILHPVRIHCFQAHLLQETQCLNDRDDIHASSTLTL